MTFQPISSTDPYSTSTATAKPAAQTKQSTPQDTVHLSPQALASLDKDHDGDSH